MGSEIPVEFQPLVGSITEMLQQAAADWEIEGLPNFQISSYFDAEAVSASEGFVGVRWVNADGLSCSIIYWLSISYVSHAPSIDGVRGQCSVGDLSNRREKETDFFYSLGDRSQLDQIYETISKWSDTDLTRPGWLDMLEKFASQPDLSQSDLN